VVDVSRWKDYPFDFDRHALFNNNLGIFPNNSQAVFPCAWHDGLMMLICCFMGMTEGIERKYPDGLLTSAECKTRRMILKELKDPKSGYMAT